MSGEETSEVTGRGARRRHEERERRERTEALRWLTKPGVLVFLVAVALATAGWVMVVQASRRIPVREATVGGLELRLDDVRWVLDQMDHGENFRKPAVMMPDMPEWGSQRVTLHLALHNRTRKPQEFRGEELFLVPEIGEETPPYGALIGQAVLEPGQTLNTALHFDFDTRSPHGRLLVEWRRAGKSVYLPVPEPPEHYHLRPRGGEIALPPDGRLLLPIGNAERGAQLYAEVYGCAACHGDPALPGSNNIGPHLGRIGTLGNQRIEGVPSAQYIYQSILSPGAFIAPECQGGLPCEEPSAMPEYASLVTLQDIADLVTYLAGLEG